MKRSKTKAGDSSGGFSEFKSTFKRYIMHHPFKTVAIAVIILFVLEFVFLGILRLTDIILRDVDYPFFDFVRFKGGVESWFAFYGSYLGMIATVVLGIITLRLDVKFKYSEQTTEINKLLLREIRLYDMVRDYRPSILVKDGDFKRFVLVLIFEKFEPYYDIKIIKAKWKNEEWDDALEIDKQDNYFVKYDKQMIMYLNFEDVDSEDIEKTFGYFYRIRCYDSTMIELKQRQRQLELDIILYSEVEEISANIIITLENDGYQDGGYMQLREKDYLIKIGSL